LVEAVEFGYPGLKAGAADPPRGVISKPAAEAGSICSELVLGGALLELREAIWKPALGGLRPESIRWLSCPGF
jgi:hypothetical protein